MRKWYSNSGHPEQIEPLAITPCVEILDPLSVNLPMAFAVTKSGDRSYRAKQHRKLFHLLENLHSQKIAFNPRVKQGLGCVWSFGGDPAIELFKDRTQLRLTTLCYWPEQHTARYAEEFPPQLPSFL